MKLALAETNILWEDKQGNLGRLDEILKKLSDLGKLFEVIALPEMSFTGFTMNTALSGELADDSGKYETVEHVKKLAQKYNIKIAFGWVKRLSAEEAFKSENHYTIVDEQGSVILDYVKIHPFSYSGEDKLFDGGNDIRVGMLKDFAVGAAICYDLRFPELFQAMADKVAMIMVPANWPAQRAEHFAALLKARAIETQCYIAAVNCRGNIGGLEYQGDSMLIAPDGKQITPQEGIIIGGDKINLYVLDNDVEVYRAAFPVRKDRKNEFYVNILKKS